MHIFSKYTYGIPLDYMVGHKTSSRKFKKIEIILGRSKKTAELLEAVSTCPQIQMSLAAKPQSGQLENPRESE